MSDEPREIRLKRLHMRAWHRGTKEMDLILGGWADTHLAGADDAAIDLFERVLEEEDQDLYRWLIGSDKPADTDLQSIIADVLAFNSANAN